MIFRTTVLAGLLALLLTAGCHCGPHFGHQSCRHQGPDCCAKQQCAKCGCPQCQCPNPCMGGKAMPPANP